MTIRSLFQMLAQADASLPDNTTGAISPADVRDMFKDLIDTLTPGYGSITNFGGAGLIAMLSATPQVLAPFTAIAEVSAGYFTANLATGSITRTLGTVPGSRLFITAEGLVSGAGGNDVVVRLFANDLPTNFTTTASTSGATNKIAFDLAAILYINTTTKFDLRVSGPANSFTFTELLLTIQSQPVRDFV